MTIVPLACMLEHVLCRLCRIDKLRSGVNVSQKGQGKMRSNVKITILIFCLKYEDKDDLIQTEVLLPGTVLNVRTY